jgi:hypothetical protein
MSGRARAQLEHASHATANHPATAPLTDGVAVVALPPLGAYTPTMPIPHAFRQSVRLSSPTDDGSRSRMQSDAAACFLVREAMAGRSVRFSARRCGQS